VTVMWVAARWPTCLVLRDGPELPQVSSVNELSAASMGDPTTPLGAIIRILNNQMQVRQLLVSRILRATSAANGHHAK
jgi:hypothetical protein